MTVQRSPFLTQSVAEPEPAVVAAGDDQLPDAGLDSRRRGVTSASVSAGSLVESVAAGSLVELGDEVAGGGEHDRVQALRRGRAARR